MSSPFLHPDWPVLRSYDPRRLSRIALPLGGIGTGTVSLGGRADLHDWEIVNRPAKGFTPTRCFFMLYARPEQAPPVTRVLEGPVPVEQYEGASGAVAPNHGLPRFRSALFHAAYPFGQVVLEDTAVPLDVRLEAFNPLVPGDPDRSGIPAAILRFVLRNPGNAPVEIAIAGNIRNFIGMDGRSGQPNRNRNEFRKDKSRAGIAGLFLHSEGVPSGAEQWGTMALTMLTVPDVEISARPMWREIGWGRELLDLWEDFAEDGAVADPKAAAVGGAAPPPDNVAPCGTLGGRTVVRPAEIRALTFLVTWHFPNRRTWTPQEESAASCNCGEGKKNPDCIGNYYTTQYRDAWDVAEKTAAALPELEADTLAFVSAFCESDLPEVIKEAALFNLSTLRTQTCFRTADGRFYGWEGCHDHDGCCPGSCTHVWNYEQATAFLFPSLARSMREVEFRYATDNAGHMNFRVSLPLDRANQRGLAAADGQMGCIMKLYRDWQLSGDDAFLRTLWPNARRALEFCWVPGGWDGDADGVMEGCQHNTMDVEYYGPNPQMQGWYLGALRAAEEMARHMGDAEFARRCRDLFERGSRWMDEHLFNGRYYEHRVRPIADPADIAPGLRSGMGASDPAHPDFQLGTGCLVDQLVGQYTAHVCGLGYLHDPGHVRTTLRSILRCNWRRDFGGHMNPMRSFVLDGESGLLMASYPRGDRPKFPFPYFAEVMTGFEYTAAVGMIFEAMERSALRCIRAIRARYDGRKRNPFNEAECGHHYARAMASWAAVIAWTGFHYSAVDATLTFAARVGRWFWAAGGAWGTCEIRETPKGFRVDLHVLGGRLPLKRLSLRRVGDALLQRRRTLGPGQSLARLIRHK